MAAKLEAAMPEAMDIGDGWTIEFAAVSPTDGSAVSGVKITNVNVTAEDVSGGTGSSGGGELIGPYMLVPGPGA